MRGLDYRWLRALKSVIALGSFEKAAQELSVSQSAISQRIRQMEIFLAQPVLIREQPPRLTMVGQKLMGFYNKVQLLENELMPDLLNQDQLGPLQVSIAINADSLATWLLPALVEVTKKRNVELNFEMMSEHRTLQKLKSGEVAAAVGLEKKATTGCEAEYLGRMDYICVANPEFVRQYFASGINRKTLSRAPVVSFDQHDNLHHRFLREQYDLAPETLVNHKVGSSEAFIKLALSGIAYCLVPKLQVQDELKEKMLVNLIPDFYLPYRLYWHHWQLESGILNDISRAVTAYAHRVLPQ